MDVGTIAAEAMNNPAAGDFSLKAAYLGGAIPRTFENFATTTNYLDVGAVQHLGAVGGTWSRIQGSGNDSTGTVSSITATFPSAVAAGDLLVVGLGQFNATPTTTVTDSLGNTYTRAVRASGFAQAEILDIWYSIATVGGTGNVVTASFSTPVFANISIDEYNSGGGTILIDSTNFGQSLTSSTISIALNITGNDLLFGVATSSNTNGATFTAGSGFTLRHSQAFVSGTTVGYGNEDQLNVTNTVPVVFNSSTSTNIQCAAVAFKLVTTGGASVRTRPMLHGGRM
jgi:hypothetical protein